MKRYLPAPTVRLFVGKACVLMPSFVKELVRTIRQIAPGEGGDGINHLPKVGFRVPDRLQRGSERFLGSLPFNCDASDVSAGLDQFQTPTLRTPRLLIL